jgi:hypothetical protein
MQSRRSLPRARFPSLRATTSAYSRARFPRSPLGCVVSRGITDDAGRAWRVREFHAAGGLALFFQCQVAGVRPEVRTVRSSLESLTDDELVTALQAQMAAE